MNSFDAALDFILSHEGGFVNDPDDPGGATNKGVTQKVYDARRDLCGLPRQSVEAISDDEVRNIYLQNYWKRMGCDAMQAQVALVVMDTAVNFGVARALCFMNLAAGRLPDQMGAPPVHRNDALQLVGMRRAWRYQRVIEKPDQTKFLKGWLNRDRDLERAVA